ncbi:MAG: hypothetical protein EU536_04820 [Promethearchaeota archaeon]|nr:MAG: hypothetical protein EU536_04820 [Candidatus Lokiarchaeota archaeon]
MLWLGVLACIGANIFWILSAILVSKGLNEIKIQYSTIFQVNEVYNLKIEVILKYLAITLFFGLLTQTLILAPILYSHFTFFSWYSIPAGILLYAAGTGLYYFCSSVYLRAEIASQFTRIKPLFAIILGIFVFKELFVSLDMLSIVLVTIGILLFLLITIRGKFGYLGLVLGLTTALCWAFGDFFMNLAYLTTPENSFKPYVFTYHGTFIGLFSILSVILILTIKNKKIKMTKNLHYQLFSLKTISINKFFALHGVLSIALGYTANHLGIYILGISGAAIITSFWPILSLIIGYSFIFTQAEREQYQDKIGWLVLIAGILLIASVLYII